MVFSFPTGTTNLDMDLFLHRPRIVILQKRGIAPLFPGLKMEDKIYIREELLVGLMLVEKRNC